MGTWYLVTIGLSLQKQEILWLKTAVKQFRVRRNKV